MIVKAATSSDRAANDHQAVGSLNINHMVTCWVQERHHGDNCVTVLRATTVATMHIQLLTACKQYLGTDLSAASMRDALSQVCAWRLWARKACRHCTVARRTLVRGCLKRGHRRGISCSKDPAETVWPLPKTTVKR